MRELPTFSPAAVRRPTFPATTGVRKERPALDIRQRFGVSLVWQPVFVKNDNIAARYLVNNWQLAVLGVRQFLAPCDADGSGRHHAGAHGFHLG